MVTKELENSKYKFVHFDSLSIVFNYFSEKEAKDFINFIMRKANSLNKIFVASTLELPRDDRVIRKVKPIFNKKIYLGF